ncbi:hypothetical protein H0G86_013156 [Trichoderma simmonsii]|uniref:Uncharacterized protein n=1 Tax=Trichoderma simmonsii TaxID=1491479 RepID=A0A8G0LPX5_9HYPO|nr:hypothetical protein H0G86_013156 [Trichoderma simmonsii]
MVASTPEYHILGKRVPVNRLRLGTIITSIQGLTRLNSGKEPTIDEKRLDNWHDTDFKATRGVALKGDVGIEFKMAALGGIGSEGKVDGERGNVEKYNFGAIDTLEFESTLKDYNDAGQAEEVQTFLKKSKYRPVFYITGIKVGRFLTDEDSEPTFEATRVKNIGGAVSLGGNIPPTASIGPKIAGSKNSTITQQYKEHNDRIFAIRVRKLQYKKKRFFGNRSWVNESYNDGAEMVGVHSEEQEEEESEIAFDEVEEVDLEGNEMKGYEKITQIDKRGHQVTYVAPKAW